VREAEHLLESGFRELVLISQDVTSYGRDLPNADLPRLIRALGRIGGTFWIRLLYGFPSRVTDDLLETMAAVPQVCHYLDLPIQHSHPQILQAMRRARTVRHVHHMAARLREAMPDIALRTTCLVGFPGETEEHFRHLVEFVRRTEFDHLGVFVFSPEEDTAAARLLARPPRKLAEERRRRLLTAQKEIVDRMAAARTGEQTTVLLERPVGRPARRPDGTLADADPQRAEWWVGRAPRQAPEVDGETLVSGIGPKTEACDFVAVRYTGFADYDMLAAAVADPAPRP